MIAGLGLVRRIAMLGTLSVALSACSMIGHVPTSLEDPGAAPVTRPERVQLAQPRAVKATVKWRNCGQRFDCASLRVPVDYRRPKAGHLSLSMVRLPAPEKADRIGSLIVNPGGPGGSGVDFVRRGAVESVPAEVRARFDIVGFDPRGVGRSGDVSCGGAPAQFLAQDFMPESPGDLGAVLSAARAVADACAAMNPTLLPHMSTENVAKDLDRLRAAVGDRYLTYLGFSYGSTIGLDYAQQFPTNVRAMVLDGPVDPSVDGLQRARDQAVVLEKTLREFFEVCPKEPQCRGYARGLTMKRFDQLLSALHRSPIPAPSSRGGSLHASEACRRHQLRLVSHRLRTPAPTAGRSRSATRATPASDRSPA